ncbi:hypothetical protein M407DRAFT_242210 [Tulasnella calospora MUT 4182]|uniref:GAF domain-containing protein n=1 Tax=Tulasnella calospora MUT 4182 TaxID=1051891 RepID=A0A0C3L9D7_9AGAM|nr:hypothetical protein M407DRAFT_242210 [Tulasnella calospora MUT 4182]
MPHADSSLIPSIIQTKEDFWSHVHQQLEALIESPGNWVSNLSNAASLVYNALRSFKSFGDGERAVNWCGFYLDAAMFPGQSSTTFGRILHLGPFNGRPACQLIRCEAGKGVCADAWAQRRTILVEEVDAYPGHIACDGETKSEIVVPMIWDGEGGSTVLGVMDLDCLALGGFDEADQRGLEKIVQLLVKSCLWNI